MKLISPVLRDNIEGGTRFAPVFGREVRCFQFHFLNEIGADVVHQAAITASNQVERSVDCQIAGIAAIAVNSLVGSAEAGGHAELVGVRDDSAGNQRHQLRVGAAIQRKVVHLLSINDAGNFAGDRV